MKDKSESDLFHDELWRALEAIQKACVTEELQLFPAVCAMMTIIKTYKKEHPGALSVIERFEKLLEVNELHSAKPEVH